MALLRLCTLAAVLAATGCPTPERRCATDADCTAGLVCDASACVPAPPCADPSCQPAPDRRLAVCAQLGEANPVCRTPGAALELALGAVAVGTEVPVRVTLQSTGAEDVQVTAVRLASVTGYTLRGPAAPLTVAAGQQAAYTVAFLPIGPGVADALLVFETDVPGDARLTLSLTGSGRAGCQLAAEPAGHDFGTVDTAGAATFELTLRNRGPAPCALAGAPTLAGATGSFSLVNPPADGRIVAADATLPLAVRFAPRSAAGPESAQVVVAVSGPGTERQELRIALSGTSIAAPRCSLSVDPAALALAFPSLEVGAEAVRTVTLRNDGAAPCSLARARIAGSAAHRTGFAVHAAPIASLAPGATTPLSVAFRPVREGLYGAPGPAPASAALFVDTGDTDRFPAGGCTAESAPTGPAGCIGWRLTGSATLPALGFAPSRVDVGSVYVGCRSPTQTITLQNGSAATFQIRSLSAAPAAFGVLPPATPFPLAAEEARTFGVRFTPTSAGPSSGQVTVETDLPDGAGGSRRFTLPVAGLGVAPATAVEQFVQNTPEPADLLFVVDDSGSMSQYQAQLASSMSPIVSLMNQRGVDYQLGVVTTSVADFDGGPLLPDAGVLQGNPKVIVRGPTASSRFAATVDALGTDGSGNEMGLEAMRLALTGAGPGGRNAGFLRTGGRLAVVVVSDEEDVPPSSPPDYAAFLDAVKGPGTADRTSLWAITGLPGGTCAASEGTRYLAVQAATGGQAASICDASWTPLLTALADSLGRLQSRFVLQGAPDPATLRVLVDGVTYPTSAWDWDASAGAVVFLPHAIPDAGETIRIEYRNACH